MKKLALYVAGLAFLASCASGVVGDGPRGALLPRQSTSSGRGLPRASAGELYVAAFNPLSVEVLNNGSYEPEYAITKGLANPQGLWLDSQSNLYVANYLLQNKKYADTISEYANGGKKPKCTYDTGSDAIVGVTTDSKGNVYTADDSSIAPGISEFAQCGKAIQFFKTPHPATGLAFDSHGNLLVAMVLPHYKSEFVEFLKGSSKATPLKLETGVTDGIALDARDNLVVPDVVKNVIHVSAPPYETSTTFAKGVTGAAFVALNHDESLLFCSGYAYVWVFDYPSGTYVTKITGLGDPKGVADAPPPP